MEDTIAQESIYNKDASKIKFGYITEIVLDVEAGGRSVVPSKIILINGMGRPYS